MSKSIRELSRGIGWGLGGRWVVVLLGLGQTWLGPEYLESVSVEKQRESRKMR